MATSALSLNHIDAFYGDSHVLGDVSFELGEARMLHHVKRDSEAKQHLELALKAHPQFQDARTLLAELEKVDGTNKDVVPVSHETPAAASK